MRNVSANTRLIFVVEKGEGAMTDHAIWAEGLVKHVGKTKALGGVGLCVRVPVRAQ